MNKNKIYNLIIVALLLIVSACNTNKNLFLISADGMSPTLNINDMVRIYKSDSKYNYGDIIACYQKELAGEQNYINISRIVGLPRDSIYVKHEVCVINNKENRSKLTQKEIILDYELGLSFDEYEEIFPNGEKIRILICPELKHEDNITQAIEIPDDYYFIMGDNRDNSYDSREFGPIHKDSIIGKVVEIIPAQ